MVTRTFYFLLGIGFAWASFTFVSYCAILKLKDMRDDGRLNLPIKILAYPTIVPMYVIYVGLNVFVASVIFLDIPREVAFTKRCERYLRGKDGWRKKQAAWWCRRVLDPVERGGVHCKCDT